MDKIESFDYIVIGGGAAGCVVASRLSEDPNKSVLLLEEGLSDKNLFIRMNGGYFKIMGTKRTVSYQTTPNPFTDNRTVQVMRASTLGGGHSINAMVYIRGQKEDYDGWVKDGCHGWSYKDVLPYFKKAENNSRLGDPFHGKNGPLHITDNTYKHPLNEPFISATIEAGNRLGNSIKFNKDFNGYEQNGVGYYQISSKNGERCSSARAYITPVINRKNLTIRLHSQVSKILINNSKKAEAVIVKNTLDSTEIQIKAKHEIILCAGAIISPKILMLSGIGPAEHLKEKGIRVVQDLKGVGSNYQDHLVVPVDAELKDPISLVGQDKGLNALKHGAEWLFFKKGLLSSNLVETGGFFDLDGDGRPEIQIHTLAMASTSWGKLEDAHVPVHGYSVAPCCLTSYSRGKVLLNSRNPEDTPIIDANYLSDSRDLQNLIRGVKFCREILKSPSLAPYIKSELMPGSEVSNTPEDLEQYVRSHVQNAFHPAGTCAMGIHPEAVVDLNLCVYGIKGLRVADASIMPTLVRGNTTAPVIMIAERVADFISKKNEITANKAIKNNNFIQSKIIEKSKNKTIKI